METLKSSEFRELCKQHWPDIMSVEFICPSCKKVQTGNDLISVGAGKDLEEVNGYLGFSCLGRWNKDRGCDWTLGGLFHIHELEIISDEDETKKRPCFKLNLPQAAQ